MEMDSQNTNGADEETTVYHPVIYKKTQGSLTLTNEHFAFHASGSNGAAAESLLPYQVVMKHQVSPANYPKSLLKVILKDGNKSVTFQLTDRAALEKIRKDIAIRLKRFQGQGQGSNHNLTRNGSSNNINMNGTTTSSNSKKRPHAELLQRSSSLLLLQQSRKSGGAGGPLKSMDDLDATALAVTRSSLLAANPSLRSQHKFLVEETKTVDEDDFWKTHDNLLQEEYAKICGMARAGTSSLLQSHLPLQGRVTLGVSVVLLRAQVFALRFNLTFSCCFLLSMTTCLFVQQRWKK
jgi:transcription initiation factor TFIIH subunit 1